MSAPDTSSPRTVTLIASRAATRESDFLANFTVPGTDVSLAALLARVRPVTQRQVRLLHDGGLSLGVNSGAVRLEVDSDWRPSPAWRREEAPPLARARAWQLPGFFAEVRAWIEAGLAQHGEHLTGEFTQVGTNDFACVLRADTSGGGVYFKAGSEGREAGVALLAARPGLDLAPPVLAADAARGWLLTRDGGRRLHEEAEVGAWHKALQGLADLQRALNPAELTSLGCPTHCFTELPARAEALLLNEDALRDWELTPGHVRDLAQVLPRLHRAHARLSALGMGEWPVHGDAHPMNVLHGARGVRWFDWSEAALAHPLLDAGWFLAWLTHPARENLPLRGARPDLARELWRAYLDAVGAASSAEALLGDAVVLALLQRALDFDDFAQGWQGTVPGWRPQGVPYFLRTLLKAAEQWNQTERK